MALVAYSDESDFSDEEEILQPSIQPNISKNTNPTSSKNSFLKNISNSSSLENGTENDKQSGIDSIIDEDDEFLKPSSVIGSLPAKAQSNLLSALPAAVGTRVAALDLGDDELTDVPTKETWKPAQEILNNKVCDISVSDFSLLFITMACILTSFLTQLLHYNNAISCS